MTNPYAEHLGTRDPMAVIGQTPGELRRLAGVLDKRLELAPAPDKWSGREIVCHLADVEIAYGFRFRQVLAEEHHVIQPFDQDRWAESYSAYDVETALATFAALRAWNIAFIKGLTPEAKSTRAWHPQRGETTLQLLVETMAGHDLNHIKQLEKIAAQA